MTMVKSKSFYVRRILPLAKALDKDKWKGFAVMYSVWLVDLATTAIALGLFSNEFHEFNPAAASFFSLGLYGWLAWMIVAGVILYGVVMLPSVFMWITSLGNRINYSKIELKRKIEHYNVLRLFNICFIIIAETLVIISNINNLLSVI